MLSIDHRRTLNGDVVRALKRRPHKRQLSLLNPSVVRRFRVAAVVKLQRSAFIIIVSLSGHRRRYATPMTSQISRILSNCLRREI